MALSIRVQGLPKAGNRDDEYEDAVWPAQSLATTQPVVRCAVADGATESAFAGMWARQLVRAYAQGALGTDEWEAGLAHEQMRWEAQIASKVLPWYAEEKASRGAFAALLGVTIDGEDADGERRWHVFGAGDCTLFQVRHGGLLCSVPAVDASFFTNSPLLISSKPERNQDLSANIHRASGALRPGDRLYLASDALAHWVLSTFEHGEAPWHDLEAALARGKRGFRAWVHERRHSGQMRNDDITLLCIAWLER